jgi:hypothetical protein
MTTPHNHDESVVGDKVQKSSWIPAGRRKWLIAGLGLVLGGAYFWHNSSQSPTIRFVGYGPSLYPVDLPGDFPLFETRNDTRHPFSIVGDERFYRILTSSGVREERESMNCTGAEIFTLQPGQSFRGPHMSGHAGAGQRFAIGIRFYRGTKASLSAPRSTIAEFVSEVIYRVSGESMKPRVTWSDFTKNPP